MDAIIAALLGSSSGSSDLGSLGFDATFEGTLGSIRGYMAIFEQLVNIIIKLFTGLSGNGNATEGGEGTN